MDTVIVPTKTRSGETEYLAIRYDATLRESRFRKRESEQDNLLIQQSKLAAMGEMISMIAHQWRQPLSTINALTLDLRTDMDLGLSTPESIAEGLGQINDVTEHLSATINDFRDFFKPDTVAQEMALSTIISRALALTKQSFHARSVAINCELADLPPLPIHPGKVVQVLLNLLKNAEDALMERGVAHPAITIRSMEEHPFQYIEVCDNGGGIPPEALSQIFNPYYSTKGENGTGLGLYMSRMIIERYCRGELSVTNTDAGACFRIKIHTKAIQ